MCRQGDVRRVLITPRFVSLLQFLMIPEIVVFIEFLTQRRFLAKKNIGLSSVEHPHSCIQLHAK